MRCLHPLFLIVPALALTVECARTQEAQIDQARQFESQSLPLTPLTDAAAISFPVAGGGGDGESFGIQQLLRDAERLRSFRTFADLSAFVTNNVALTRKEPRSDAFLLATLGLEFRKPLPRGLQFDASLRTATFRYHEFYQLDFVSIDAGFGASYHTARLGGLDFFARYNFNELVSVATDEAFFKNHTITLGVQKAVAFSQAHYAFLGAAGQIGFADPKVSERSEVSAFAGYHLQITRHLEADLFYRHAFLLYSEGDRIDQNQTLSLGLRYHFTDWFSASASTYAGWNRSNEDVFNYDVANGGGGLSLSLQF